MNRTFIKPKEATPDDRKKYILSWFDRCIDRTYTPLVFLFDNDAGHNSSNLKRSLSQALNLYYPFSGRLHKSTDSITCNDAGGLYIETHLNHSVSNFYDNSEFIGTPIPDGLHWKDVNENGDVLAIQVSHFIGGGLALAVCLSHRIGDFSTLTNFLKYWSGISRGVEVTVELEDLYDACSFFNASQKDCQFFGPQPEILPTTVGKKYVFDKEQIAHLKNMRQHIGKGQATYIRMSTSARVCLKETLRLHPPAPLLLPRETISHFQINGYDIHPKTLIQVNAWAIGRDPQYWNNPEEFIPERFADDSIDFKGQNFEYLPFGSGRRICPGIYMATTSVELGLANLLYWFDWKLPQGMTEDDINMEEKAGLSLTVSMKVDLQLVPVEYFCRQS
ncbi:hypothetical protein FNV43_RR25898 [Rhamnella rubrinervis]|uniref:Cytochrome P450 n=1 Tax=Rhamnella rubrinervis TaxID=2594499 RepID=A0A8K0DLL4_9ROSA|nr:hypothetical protein FNV43_RR25898 [Rhamnella rubrinervis]